MGGTAPNSQYRHRTVASSRRAAGQPGLIGAAPSVRYLLLQIPPRQKPYSTLLKLDRLNLATGRVTYVPSRWLGLNRQVITW